MPTVLLTNDDGITAAGLRATRDALLDAGLSVVVVAPDGNRSAMGHRVTISAPLVLERVEGDGRGDQWACSGTPADCVRAAYFSSELPDFDLVVSGTNHGPNLGEDVFYSGTVAAAVEAALLGLPAIAVSQAGGQFPASFLATSPAEYPHSSYVGGLARRIVDDRPDLERTVLNVNLPWASADAARPVVTRLGSRDWRTTGNRTERISESRVEIPVPWAGEPEPRFDEGTDFAALRDGAISVSPLLVRGGLMDLSADWLADPPAFLGVGRD